MHVDLEARLKRLMVFRVVMVTTLLFIATYVEAVSETLFRVNPVYFVIGATYAAKARVALFKGLLIFGAALAVAGQIGWRIMNVETPVVETMGIAAVLNLAANLLCLRLLYPYRNSDVNMSSVWECSRNDVMEGVAVIAAAISVWAFASGWPDILIAIGLVVLFLRSAARVLRSAWRELYPVPSPS